MPMTRNILVLVVLAACSSSEPAAPGQPPPAIAATPQCTSESKSCGGACVSTSLPEVGCGGPTCAPCALPHASATCSADARCATAACENGFGDCNRTPSDGCEVDLTSTDASCGACGVACGATQVCRKSACVDRNVADAQSWLSGKNAGWCFETYNQMMNLCGDVDFCFDARFMRAYPTGLAVDVAFDFESTTADGNIVKLGGDCGGEALGIVVTGGSTITAAGFNAGVIQVGFTPGKHLVSYQISPSGSALYVDGVRAGVGAAPQAAIKLRDSCGPGLVLGQRLSYWWEIQQKPAWAHMAPFFMQLREGVADASAYSVARATSAGAGTVLLFDQTGAAGSSWTATVGGLVGAAKNTLSGDPELDASASGPLPRWKPFAQCLLR